MSFTKDVAYAKRLDTENDTDRNIERSERRALLPPSPELLTRASVVGAPTSTTSSTHTSNGQRTTRRQPSISVRRKMHDIRLRTILNTSNDNDDEVDYSMHVNDRVTRRKDDWIRPYWLGFGLFLTLYSFWILDTLKDPVFGALTDGTMLHYNLPRAKLFSVFVTLSLVILLEYIAKEQKKHSKRQQRQSLVEFDNDDSIHCQVRSHDDVLDGSGTWNRMNIGTSISYNSRKHAVDDSDDHSQRAQIFITIGVPFCVFFGIIAYFLQYNPNTAWTAGNGSGTATGTNDHPTTKQAWSVLGYCIYAAVESFGSLMVATFWSYTNSTLTLHDAESYYGTIIAFAQMGAIAGSTMVTMHVWSSITLYIVACLLILLHIIVMVTYNRRFTPTRPAILEDVSKNSSSQKLTQFDDDDDDDDEPIFQLSGVRLILKHNYVLLILGVSCLYEVSLTCLNYQMTLLGWSRFEETSTLTYDASSTYQSRTNSFIDMMSFTQFMGHYGQVVNISSLLLSSFLFPTLIYRVGLKYTLRVFPTLLLCVNVIAFIALPGNLAVLFFSMAFLKAMTYSIHDPSKEILYIPTSNSIQFNAKFWIDVVGARVAKAVGSSINHVSGSVHRSIRVASAPSLITAMGLWYVCYRIGTHFDNLIEGNIIVGIDDDNDYNEDEGNIHGSRTHKIEYSDSVDDDGDGQGLIAETDASFELTAL
jgi:ATP/ADP translocase